MMGKKTTELCKWDKGSYGEKLPELETIVRQPRFACTSCGRVAHARKFLCKPVKMSQPES